MRSLIFAALIILSVQSQSSGIKGFSDAMGKSSAGCGASLTVAQFKALYNSDRNVCVKDGGKWILGNKAYSKNVGAKKYCTDNPKSKNYIVAQKKGLKVIKIDYCQLPAEIMK